jgi:hypothetical protein
MKRCMMLLAIVVCLAGCNSSDDGGKSQERRPVTLQNHLDQFWTWPGSTKPSHSLESDHAACDRESKTGNRKLQQIKAYWDCMEAKGWQRNEGAWRRLAQEKQQ